MVREKIWIFGGRRAIGRAKKHRVGHLDGTNIYEPNLIGNSGYLCTMAEFVQQLPDLAKKEKFTSNPDLNISKREKVSKEQRD